jgi:ABC-type branched-subunit amino acid transport system ATPase component
MIWVEHDKQMVADLADHIRALGYGRSLTEGDGRRFEGRARDWPLLVGLHLMLR